MGENCQFGKYEPEIVKGNNVSPPYDLEYTSNWRFEIVIKEKESEDTS